MSLPLTTQDDSASGTLLRPDGAHPQAAGAHARISPNDPLIRFRYQSRVTPEAAKMAQMAGRLNASSASDAEYTSLIEERQRLVERELSGAISRREKVRLTYVRWSLDRIEDARYGSSFDELEAQVAQLEKFSDDVDRLRQQLANAARRRR